MNGATVSTIQDELRHLSQDVDATCTRLVMILTDPLCYKEILTWRGESAQSLIDLLQTHLVCFPPESPNRRLFLRVLLKLSRRSGLYPECLVRNDVQLIGTDPIAAGRFGEVWKGRMPGHELIAVKILRVYIKSDAEKLLKEFSTEAVTWRQLSHPNVLPFYGVFHLNNNRTRVCLISPWMENGNIVQFLQRVPDANRITLILDIAQGLKYLHMFKPTIIHGDLKGVNIVITNQHRACLADFGLASVEDSQALALSSVSGGRTTGTCRWQAPELLDSQSTDLEGQGQNNCASDIYAFACVCYEIYSGNVPFYEISNDCRVILAVTRAERPPRPPHGERKIRGILDGTIWDLIETCWMQQPAERPTAKQIVYRLHSAIHLMVQDDVKLTDMTLVALNEFGEIWKGLTHTGEGIAVKVLRVQEGNNAKLLEGLSTEAKTWQKLSHPNVLPFRGLCCLDRDLPSLGFISPWMENGNVVQFLRKEDVGRVPFILDIAEGLEYLHDFKPTILHGSLKCANVLVTPEGRVCLANFGLASLEDSQFLFSQSRGATKGITRWQAPELLDALSDNLGRQSRKSLHSDIYSLACVMYELYSGMMPFFEIQADLLVVHAVTKGQRPSRPSPSMRKIYAGWDLHIWNLIESCWAQQPEARPTASEVVAGLRTRIQNSSIRRRWSGFRPGSSHSLSVSFSTASSPALPSGSSFTSMSLRGSAK